jgi:hypothetical protein
MILGMDVYVFMRSFDRSSLLCLGRGRVFTGKDDLP